jgi:hypothetical protein
MFLTAPADAANTNIVTIVSGDQQSTLRTSDAAGGTATFKPLEVLVTDLAKKPVAGVRVTFICAAPPAMTCRLSPRGDQSAFVMSDSLGHAVLNQMDGNAASTSYAGGTLKVNVTGDTFAPIAFTLTATTPTPAPPNTVTIVSGNNQTRARTGSTVPGGTATFGPLTVLVSDTAGKPVSGARVDWVCAGPSGAQACQLSPSGGASALTTTDSQGHATLNQMGGNSAATTANGPAVVMVSGPTFNGVAFTLTTTAEAVPPVVFGNAFTINGGNNQKVDRSGSTVPGGIASFGAISVKLVSGTGTPLANVPITFSCHVPGSWTCRFDPTGTDGGTYTVATDANGIATLNRMGGNAMNVSFGSGAFTVTAAYGTQITTFNETVTK